MIRVLILISVSLIVLSCTKIVTIEQRIVQKANSCNVQSSCVIRVKELTDFDWDEMHAFSEGASQQFIEKALGIPFPDYVEFKRRIVFLKAGKLVHREDEPTDIEHPIDGQVNFAESYAEPSHWSFSPETAVFNVERHKCSHGSIYLLTQLKSYNHSTRTTDQ
jgi:hypothetical protein